MRSAVQLSAIIFALQCVALVATALLFQNFGGSLAHEISGQDAREYMVLGEQILTGGDYQVPGKTVLEMWRPPGYPAFVAGIFAITGHSLAILLTCLAFIGAAISGLIYLIGRVLSLSHRSAQVAGVLFGVSPAVIWIPPSGMGGDILFTFFSVLALYILLRLPTYRTWYLATLGAGMLLGSAALVRPLGLYFAPLIITGALFCLPEIPRQKLLKIAVVALFGFALMITPWMARNQAVAGHFALSSQFAFNPFYYNLPIFFAWQRNTNEETERLKLLDRIGTRDPYDLINGFVYTDQLKAIDKQFLKENFVPYVAFHLIKTLPFFVGSGVNVVYATITNEIPSLDLPFAPRAEQNTASLFYSGSYTAVAKNLIYYWPSTFERLAWLVVFALAFVAPFVTTGRQRRFAIFSAIFIIAVAVLASPIAQPRYRIPAEPFIWLGAALAVSALVESMKRGRRQ